MNKKNEIDSKVKAVPAVLPLELGQKTKTSKSKVPVAISEPVGVEKKETEKKAQTAKQGGKGQQTPSKEPTPEIKEPTPDEANVPSDTQLTAPSEAKVDDGETKAKKGKEAKAKKQVATEPEVPPAATETTPVSKTGASEKPTKMKRLTLDIAKPLHKAIKAKAVEEGVPMVDMLRSLLEEHYRK